MKLLLVLFALCAVAHGRFMPKFGSRIVGGQAANIKDFPYQASVRIYDQHICGGSIIDETTILTAAHCVHGMDQSQYSVRVGSTTHNDGEKFIVSRVVKNLNYNPDTTDYDMAILKLQRPLRFTSLIQPIDLMSTDAAPGSSAYVSGWGVMFEGSDVVPESLRAVAVAVISDAQCKTKYGSSRISRNMMCAQTSGKDSCQGDSGGPLRVNNKLVGVVSWGVGCAREAYPGVYASVPVMMSWIQANRY